VTNEQDKKKATDEQSARRFVASPSSDPHSGHRTIARLLKEERRSKCTSFCGHKPAADPAVHGVLYDDLSACNALQRNGDPLTRFAL